MAAGLILFGFGAWRAKTNARSALRNALWIAPWLVGHLIIGWLGRYGDGARSVIPNWLDVVIVIAFSLIVFYWGINLANSSATASTAIARDLGQLDSAGQREVKTTAASDS
jgi:hypothetical protein